VTYCLGPRCRDLTPVRGPRSKYCSECYAFLYLDWRRQSNRKWLKKPGSAKTKRASTLAWYHRTKTSYELKPCPSVTMYGKPCGIKTRAGGLCVYHRQEKAA
jgi:hypothetical protein